MSTNKVIGTFREKRGEDHYRVVTTEDGDVIGIEQYDANGHRWIFLNLFADSAPGLIKLISKAAGIKTPKVEYEYNIEHTDLMTGRVWLHSAMWEPNPDWLKRKLEERDDYDRKLLNIPRGGGLEYSRRLVKRVVAGPVEAA